MELGKTELVGVLHDEGVDVRDIDAGLDDRRADKHLDPALDHIVHDAGELFLVHFAVRHADGNTAAELLLQPQRRMLDVFHPVMEIVHLPAADKLAPDGVAHGLFVLLHHERLYGLAVARRLLDGGHAAQAGERHVECARDRRGRERQHIDALRHFLELFLVRHAEALLLVHDEKAEIPEGDALLQQTVRADQKIDAARERLFENVLFLAGRTVPGKERDLDRVAEKAAHCGLVMLAGEHRGGHEDRALLAVENALHGRAQRDLRFAVADVAAEQAVHRHRLFHIGLDLLNAPELIVRFGVAERLFKLRLPRAVRRKGVARRAGARGIELCKLGGELLRRGLGAGRRPFPLRAAHARELHGAVLAAADVFRHKVELRRRNVQTVRPGVTYFNVVLFHAVHRQPENAGEAADAVVLVHHEIADREIGAGAELLTVRHGAAALAASQRARGDLRVGQHGKARLRRLKSRGERPHRDGGAPLRRKSAVRKAAQRRYAVSLEHRGEHVRPSPVRGEHHDAESVFQIPLHVGKRRFRAAAVAGELADVRIERRPRRERIASRAEGVRHHNRKIRDLFAGGLPREKILPRVRHGERPLAQNFQIVRKSVCNVLRFFGAAVRRVDIEYGVRRDIVERRCIFAV